MTITFSANIIVNESENVILRDENNQKVNLNGFTEQEIQDKIDNEEWSINLADYVNDADSVDFNMIQIGDCDNPNDGRMTKAQIDAMKHR